MDDTKSEAAVQQENSPSHILDFGEFFDAVVGTGASAEAKMAALIEAREIFQDARDRLTLILDGLEWLAFTRRH